MPSFFQNEVNTDQNHEGETAPWETANGGQFRRPQKVGFVWSVTVSSKEITGRVQTGGKTYHRWGGPNPFLGRGFMLCFPLLRVFHPLLRFSERVLFFCLTRQTRIIKGRPTPKKLPTQIKAQIAQTISEQFVQTVPPFPF